MIRVVQISTTQSAGGAALAAQRLHAALNAHGARSTMFVGLAQSGGPDVREFQPLPLASASVNRWLFRAGRRLQRRVECVHGPLFSLDWTVFGRGPLRQLPPADVYHLHWAADLVDFRWLPALAQRAPVVWTLHDMNPFTGGCHYDEGCGRFEDACGRCPLLASADPGDVSARVLRRKASALAAVSAERLTVVTPSRWLAGEARRSTAFGRFDAHVLPNGINLETFRPAEDRAAVRQRFGFQPQDRVVLFVADVLNDVRKGWAELARALAEISRLPSLRVLTLGSGDTQHMSGPHFRHLGQLKDAAAIRDAYCAADVFVIPSLQDNFPNTVLESLACGTPVAGFAAGGITEAVEDGTCGSLAPVGDTAELARRLTALLTDETTRAAMGAAGRTRAQALYGLETQAAACLQLYRRLLARAGNFPAEQEMPFDRSPILERNAPV